MFYLIAAAGKNRELGKKGGLVWHLPGDLKYFKEVTTGYPVFMGENTFRSLPKMLPGREHFVLSKNQPDQMSTDTLKDAHPILWSAENGRVSLSPNEIFIVNDLDAFIAAHENSPEVVFVIGGASVYAQMLPHCKKLYLTEVNAESDEADVFFPEFDKNDYIKEVVGKGEDNGVKYTFVTYEKK